MHANDPKGGAHGMCGVIPPPAPVAPRLLVSVTALTLFDRNELNFTSPCAAVAQLDRVPGFEPGGRGFESLRPRHETKSLAMCGAFLFHDAAGGIGTPDHSVAGSTNAYGTRLDIARLARSRAVAQWAPAMDGVGAYPSARATSETPPVRGASCFMMRWSDRNPRPVRPDAFTRTFNMSSRRPNDSTRMYWLGGPQGCTRAAVFAKRFAWLLAQLDSVSWRNRAPAMDGVGAYPSGCAAPHALVARDLL